MTLKSAYSKSFLKSLAIAIPSVSLPLSHLLNSKDSEVGEGISVANKRAKAEESSESIRGETKSNAPEIAESSSVTGGSGGPSPGVGRSIGPKEENAIKARIQHLIGLLEKISKGMGDNTHLLLPNGKSASLKELSEKKEGKEEILNFYFRGYGDGSGGSGLHSDSWGGKEVEWSRGRKWSRLNELMAERWNGNLPDYEPLIEMFIKSLEEGVNFQFERSGYLGCYQKDIDFFTEKTKRGCEANQRYRMVLREIYETKGRLELLPRILIGDYSGWYDRWLINLMDRDGQNLYFSEGANWGARRLSMDEKDKEYIFEFRTALTHMKYRILKKIITSEEDTAKLKEIESLWSSIKDGGYLSSHLHKYKEKLIEMEKLVDSLKKVKSPN